MKTESNATAVSALGENKLEYQDFPVYEESLEANYVDGYVPVSYEAPHSSLIRTSTWVGMGLLLTSLAGFGMLIFGLASKTMGSQENWDIFVIIGVIFAVVCLVGGFGGIFYGRRNLREWRAKTGRRD